jgi:acyltransferase
VNFSTYQINERLVWVDNLKAIGIYFIFLGHLDINSQAVQYLFSFHVPIFFFISGYLFDSSKYEVFKTFFLRRLKTLIVPYFFFAFTLFFLWLFIIREFSIKGEALKIHPLTLIMRIFYSGGLNYGESVPINAMLWFLTCLFLLEIIFWLINKIVKENKNVTLMILLLCGLLSCLDSVFIPIRLPWNIDKAMNASVFYGTAFVYKKHIDSYVNLSKSDPRKICALILFFSANIVFCFLNGTVNYNFKIYHNIIFYYLSAFAGILFYIGISSYVTPNRIISYVGKNTIILLGFSSVIVTYLINAIYLLCLKKFPDLSDLSLGSGIVIAAVQILSMFPFIYLISRYVPFLIGRSKLK